MQGPFLRKYGVQTTINFHLFEIDGVDFRVDAADAGADCSIMKDEGGEATCTNDFADEGTGYSLVLTATEMQAARIVVYVIDSATKVWLDTAIVVETYGNASAMHAVDLDDSVRAGLTALPNAAADAAGGVPISDAGELDLDTKLANTNEITVARMGALTDWINGGRLDLILDIIAADTTTDIPALIANVPTVAEFEARTIVAASYVVVGDTLARVTLVDTVTTNTDLVTAAAIKTAMEADGGDLSSLMEALVNKRVWTEADGNLEMFNDADASQGNIAAQIATDGTYTTAKRAYVAAP